MFRLRFHWLHISAKGAHKKLLNHQRNHGLLFCNRYFLHKLNQKVFKTAYFKHNRKVELVSVYELDSNDDYHYHCLMARPKTKDGQPYSLPKLEQHIRQSWDATGLGSKKGVFDVTPVYSEKAYGYCQKFKNGVRLENVDWINSYVESI